MWGSRRWCLLCCKCSPSWAAEHRWDLGLLLTTVSLKDSSKNIYWRRREFEGVAPVHCCSVGVRPPVFSCCRGAGSSPDPTHSSCTGHPFPECGGVHHSGPLPEQTPQPLPPLPRRALWLQVCHRGSDRYGPPHSGDASLLSPCSRAPGLSCRISAFFFCRRMQCVITEPVIMGSGMYVVGGGAGCRPGSVVSPPLMPYGSVVSWIFHPTYYSLTFPLLIARGPIVAVVGTLPPPPPEWYFSFSL